MASSDLLYGDEVVRWFSNFWGIKLPREHAKTQFAKPQLLNF